VRSIYMYVDSIHIYAMHSYIRASYARELSQDKSRKKSPRNFSLNR